MSDGRTVWWPKDAAWWRREHVVELGEEFGADGPAVLDWLSCEAKAQNMGGTVKAGYRSLARGCFVELVTVGHVVSRAVQLGALDDFEGDERRFMCRISGWQSDNNRGRAAWRKAQSREAETPVNTGDEPPDAPVTERDIAGHVTPGHAEFHTGQDRTEEKKAREARTPSSSTKKNSTVEKAEAEGFAEWLLDHSVTTGRTAPAAGTKAYKALAQAFMACRSEGHDLGALKLATRAAHASDFRRANGYDKAESVLRVTKVHDLIEDGRRAGRGPDRQADLTAKLVGS